MNKGTLILVSTGLCLMLPVLGDETRRCGVPETQDLAKDYSELLRFMPQVVEALKVSDPQNSDLVLKTYKAALEARTEAEIDSVLQALMTSRIFEAKERQDKVTANLQALLALLTRPELSGDQPGRLQDLERQKQALEALKRREQDIQQRSRRLRPDEQLTKGDTRQERKELQEEQDSLQSDTEKTAENLEKGDKPSSKASEKTTSAAKSMGKASSSMSKGDSAQAEKEEQEAIDELQVAIDDIQKQLDQANQEKKQQALFQLAEELKKALDGQRQVHAVTAELDRAVKPYGRPEQLKLAKARTDERSLAAGLGSVIQKLDQEDADIFSWALKQCQQDMGRIAARLDQSKTDAFTQQIESDVENSLTQLIEAMREEAQKPRPQPHGAQQPDLITLGPPGRSPLVPPAAQLRFLRTLQARVYERTRDTDAVRLARPEGYETLTPEDRERVDRLALEQGRIAEITLEWANR